MNTKKPKKIKQVDKKMLEVVTQVLTRTSQGIAQAGLTITNEAGIEKPPRVKVLWHGDWIGTVSHRVVNVRYLHATLGSRRRACALLDALCVEHTQTTPAWETTAWGGRAYRLLAHEGGDLMTASNNIRRPFSWRTVVEECGVRVLSESPTEVILGLPNQANKLRITRGAHKSNVFEYEQCPSWKWLTRRLIDAAHAINQGVWVVCEKEENS